MEKLHLLKEESTTKEVGNLEIKQSLKRRDFDEFFTWSFQLLSVFTIAFILQLCKYDLLNLSMIKSLQNVEG